MRIFEKISFISTAKEDTFVREKNIKSFLNKDRTFISTPLGSAHQIDKSYAFFFFNSLSLLRYGIYFHDISNEEDDF